jgi:hypothetical protein
MRIHYTFKPDAVRLYAAKEREKAFDLTDCNHSWWINGTCIEGTRSLNTNRGWSLFEPAAPLF